MIAAACAAPLVVTVENGVVGGGAGADLADRVVERVGVRAAPPILRLGVPATFLAHGDPGRLVAEMGLDGAGIAAAVAKELKESV
jgi:1-deoxy-D-xylulose-5-phosphate synthase